MHKISVKEHNPTHRQSLHKKIHEVISRLGTPPTPFKTLVLFSCINFTYFVASCSTQNPIGDEYPPPPPEFDKSVTKLDITGTGMWGYSKTIPGGKETGTVLFSVDGSLHFWRSVALQGAEPEESIESYKWHNESNYVNYFNNGEERKFFVSSPDAAGNRMLYHTDALGRKVFGSYTEQIRH